MGLRPVSYSLFFSNLPSKAGPVCGGDLQCVHVYLRDFCVGGTIEDTFISPNGR